MAVVDDVHTTDEDVEGQDDRKMGAETEVTHHIGTKALADMEVTHQADTKVSAQADTKATAHLCSISLMPSSLLIISLNKSFHVLVLYETWGLIGHK